MNKIILSFALFFGVKAVCHGQDILKVTKGAVVAAQNGVGLFVAGGVVLDDNSTFWNAGIVTIGRTVNVTADFNDNSIASYSYGPGKFVFTGPGAQNIKTINRCEKIDVDNMDLNLLSDINSNIWYLKAGRVNTGSFLAIANSTSAAAVQADGTNPGFTKSWINGSLRRFITPAVVDNYQFPVGDAVKVNPAEMDNMTASPITGIKYVTAGFGPKPGTDAGLNVSENGKAYTSVNNGGVWHIISDVAPASGKYDVKLFFTGFKGLVDNGFGILRRSDASVNAIDWSVPAGSALPANGLAGRTIAGEYARRNGVGVFGQFAIGSSAAVLPLQLLSFAAVKRGNTVLLEWETDNEINTSHFELYRAGQPVSLQYLDKIAAAGSSGARHNYSYTDVNPLKGMGYYQLKMIDNDSKYSLSNVARVNMEDMASFNVYPNPVTGNTLFVDYNGGKINGIKLIAMDGKELACSYDNQSNSRWKITIPSLSAKGIYNVQLSTDKGVRSILVAIQ